VFSGGGLEQLVREPKKITAFRQRGREWRELCDQEVSSVRGPDPRLASTRRGLWGLKSLGELSGSFYQRVDLAGEVGRVQGAATPLMVILHAVLIAKPLRIISRPIVK
jgi:hypothetical protein